FVHNVDSLVTRDYLDARFGEFEAKFEARFTEQEAKFEARFAEINSQLVLHNWILAAIAASTVIPALHSLFSS
ncbi:MAG: hypothetical protein HOC23_08920, partial [Halieaceae bacterium]|nr:hypothetical protein [Halieaceae bacterium]